MTRRVRPLLAVLLPLLLLLAGCARIPHDGPVMRAGAPDEQVRVRALAPPPPPGASPEVVVRGFLRAALSPDADFAAGRAYLTESGSQEWHPGRQTLVYSSSELDMRLDEAAGVATGVVDVDVAYQVDASGRLSTEQAGGREFRIRLERLDGEWRIVDAPDTTLLAESDFTFVFDSYALYFLDPSASYFVPEPRWLANTEQIGSTLTDLLLAGPPQWSAGAATTAFPAGTARRGAVEVGSNSALVEVPLSADVEQVPEPARGLMRAQLLATLQQVSGATDVQLLVGGKRVDAPEVSVQALPEGPKEPVVLYDGQLHRVDGDDLQPVPYGLQLSVGQVSDPAVDYTGRRFGVLTEGRRRLLVAGTGQAGWRQAVQGEELTPPSFDWRGWLWTSERSGAVHAVSPTGRTRTVEADFLEGRRPLALRVAPDGARAAVLSAGDDGRALIQIVAVLRDRSGAPERLTAGPGSQVGTEVVSATDLTWAGGLDLVALARTQGTSVRPLRVQLWGPPHEPYGRAGAGSRVTAASTLGSILVSTQDGRILTQAGAGWMPLRDLAGSRDPAYPG